MDGVDPQPNKDQFSNGFKDVQESFYDLCSKLEKTQTGIHIWQMSDKIFDFFSQILPSASLKGNASKKNVRNPTSIF